MYVMSVFLLFLGAHRDLVDSELQSGRKPEGLGRPQEGISFEGKESPEMQWKGKEQPQQHACAGSR